ncbi:MAG: hypothetical protein ACREF3_16305, partial [Acetobacteraceae bacterium]
MRGKFPLILAAALFGTPTAHAAPTPLMPPNLGLSPPAGGGQAPAPPIEAAPLPPPSVAAPQATP